MSKEFYFCRFEGYSCVECCEGRNCSNLDELPDKTRGCLGYNIKSKKETEKTHTPSITELCRNFYCWKGRTVNGVKTDSPEMLKKIYEEIRKRPPGEYKMSAIFNSITR